LPTFDHFNGVTIDKSVADDQFETFGAVYKCGPTFEPIGIVAVCFAVHFESVSDLDQNQALSLASYIAVYCCCKPDTRL